MTNCDDILRIPDPYLTQCYCWGSGVSGCTLGIGSGKISLKPKEINVSSNSSIVYVAAGYHRTTVINHGGVCYSWGKPPLGRKTSTITSEAKVKKIVVTGKPILKVAHGENHSVLLADDGSVYSFGDAKDGKLGIRKKTRGQVILPSKAAVKKKCVDIACGFAYTTLVIDDGTLCHFGNAGLRRSSSPYDAHSFPKKITSISSGTSHLAVISSENECFTWGLTQDGRLGHGKVEDSEDSVDFIEKSPKRIEYFVDYRIRTIQVFCGGAHTCVITKDGEVYSFGWNIYGQCGVSPDNNNLYSPIKVDVKERYIVDMSCGFAHTTAIDVSGNLLVWGFNEEGQLGIGHEINIHEPTLVQFDEEDSSRQKFTINISAGKTHTVCVRSHCTPYEFKRRLKEISDKKKSISILSRFCDHIMQTVRASKLLKKQSTQSTPCSEKNITNIVTTSLENTSVKDDSLTAEESFVSSEASSYSAVEIDSQSIGDNGDIKKKLDECIRQSEENEFMKLEDNLSRRLNRSRNEYFDRLKRKKINILNEIVRRYEVFSMVKEDRYSRALLVTKKEKTMTIERMKYRQMISSRDARTNLSIKKEADRMLKSNQKSKQFIKQPKKSRLVPNSNKLPYRTHRRKQNAPNNDVKHHVPLFNNSERNKHLLIKREKRLKQKEKAQREELERDVQCLIDEEKKSWALQLSMKARMASYLTEMDKVLKTTKANNVFDLIHLKKAIDTKYDCSSILRDEEEDISDDEKYRPKSVRQWSSDLVL